VRPLSMLHALLPLAASLALGCSSSYHPEYHPVTVSNFQQNLSYPVAVHNGASPSAAAPVYVMPAPQAAIAFPEVAEPPLSPPPGFFH
jgi:hypothetical protein